jgi:NAD(P)-dependent dehydrogenase (short-subunit alcohol dehydrogenase family)
LMTLVAGMAIAVTGATRGIGRGIARVLSDEGADLVLVSRTHSDLSRLAAELAGENRRVVTVAGDVSDPQLPDLILRKATDAFGGIEGLVNNAGINEFAPIWQQTDAQFERVVATNLTAPFVLSRAFVRYWTSENIKGRIVNIGSVESEFAFPHQAPYAGTKGGLLQLTRAMALEMASVGIRVNQVDPGAIDTPMTGPFRERTVSEIPSNRLGTPEDIGQCVAFLLSERSDYVTGTKLVADGGYALQ